MSSTPSPISSQIAEETIGLVAEATQNRVAALALPKERVQSSSLSRAIAIWQAVSRLLISRSAARSRAALSTAPRMGTMMAHAGGP